MSHVTNVIVAHADPQHEVCDALNEAFARAAGKDLGDREGGFLVPSDPEWYGGTKVLTAHLLIGAFNYLDADVLIDALNARAWCYPHEVQLFIKGPESDRFLDVPLSVEMRR